MASCAFFSGDSPHASAGPLIEAAAPAARILDRVRHL